jgi:ribosomal protein S9
MMRHVLAKNQHRDKVDKGKIFRMRRQQRTAFEETGCIGRDSFSADREKSSARQARRGFYHPCFCPR